MSPYFLTGPALVSFSGGRTSAFMLHEILRAHNGQLPPDVVVAFANTGKEREETLRFVHECGTRWNVRIRWLEWRDLSAQYARKDVAVEDSFEEVGFNSASRNGEPFAALIAKKGYLPNAVTRFCTQELKVRVIRDYCRAIGWDRWNNVIGLRYDEGHRVLKALARNDANKEPFKAVMPMAKAKHTKRGHVLPFWQAQPFDLGLEDHEGNCDMCFLKSRGALKRLIRDNPSMPGWWKGREVAVTSMRATATGARFVTEYSYADLEREVATQPFMPGLINEEYDVECGLHCEPESEDA